MKQLSRDEMSRMETWGGMGAPPFEIQHIWLYYNRFDLFFQGDWRKFIKERKSACSGQRPLEAARLSKFHLSINNQQKNPP
jgi:hypothetical protein